MKKIINKIIYKTTIILLVLGFLIQTISLFPFYVFANTNNELNEVEINSVNNVDESSIRLLYEIEDLRSEYLKVFRRTDGKLEYAYYEDMVNYFDGNKYVEVDASYKLENNEYSQSISKYSVKLPKKINENKKIKLSFENSLSLEITYNDILKVEGNVIESETSTSKINELKNAYAIKLKNRSVIIQDGKISQGEILSSGTKAGLDISYVIASLMCDLHDLYYCDELFSYVNSDVEKACLSIFIDKLTDRKQLFFTTHNTDILDMQLPKHSFSFLKKDVTDTQMPIKCINAAQYLKRNTDSIKHAVENDLFCTAPELHRLYEITEV